MALIDRVKQAMSGRSEMIERAVDAAVDRAGRYSETLRKHGDGLKSHARRLDGKRSEGTATASDHDAPTSADPPATVVVDESRDAPQGSSLRGSLAPRVPGAAPPEDTTPEAPASAS